MGSIFNTYKGIINENIELLYENKVSKLLINEANELLSVFVKYGKLSGNLTEDVEFINEFYTLLKEDIDNEDNEDNEDNGGEKKFDPYSHLEQADKIDVKQDCVLTIADPNTKLGQIEAPSLSLPAGYSCPFADICKSTVKRDGTAFDDTGLKIKDHGDIRCFAATEELYLPQIRENRWSNFDLLKKANSEGGVDGMVDLLINSIKSYEVKKGSIQVFRIHESGDFYSQDYLLAWIKTANAMSDKVFYAYTKSIGFWANVKEDVPKNLRLVASEGGKEDHLIDKEGFRRAVIVKDEGEAIKRELKIDVNDFLAAFGDDDFALLLHGTQPKEKKTTALARGNGKKVKEIASKLKTTPQELTNLVKKYTT